jgi:hypothetical protein
MDMDQCEPGKRGHCSAGSILVAIPVAIAVAVAAAVPMMIGVTAAVAPAATSASTTSSTPAGPTTTVPATAVAAAAIPASAWRPSRATPTLVTSARRILGECPKLERDHEVLPGRDDLRLKWLIPGDGTQPSAGCGVAEGIGGRRGRVHDGIG